MINLYLSVQAKEGDPIDWIRTRFYPVSEGEVRDLFQSYYKIGVEYGLEELPGKHMSDISLSYIPPNLPLTMKTYPREIIEQFSSVMGYLAAVGRTAA
jgi:hypothetical protein